MKDRIREKIACLVRLADRPGTPQEGEVARLTAIRLSLNMGFRASSRLVEPNPPALDPQLMRRRLYKHRSRNLRMRSFIVGYVRWPTSVG